MFNFKLFYIESRKGYGKKPQISKKAKMYKKEKAEKQRGDYKPLKKDSKYKSEENYMDDKSKYLIWHLPENAVLQIMKHIKTYKGGPCKRFYYYCTAQVIVTFRGFGFYLPAKFLQILHTSNLQRQWL